jgi:hypothetical protein
VDGHDSAERVKKARTGFLLQRALLDFFSALAQQIVPAGEGEHCLGWPLRRDLLSTGHLKSRARYRRATQASPPRITGPGSAGLPPTFEIPILWCCVS